MARWLTPIPRYANALLEMNPQGSAAPDGITDEQGLLAGISTDGDLRRNPGRRAIDIRTLNCRGHEPASGKNRAAGYLCRPKATRSWDARSSGLVL